MNELDDREIAHRIARFTSWGFDEALRALEAGGEARKDVLAMLRSSEQTQKVLDEVAELRGASRRPRFRFLW